MPLLELTLRGAKRQQAGTQGRTHLPMTPAVLEKLNRDPSNLDHIMLWAACCLGFFGFLRSSEMSAPEVGEFYPRQHLTVQDITVDDKQNPKALSVRIKQFKTDPFRHGVSIYLCKTGSPLFPVSALLSYLVVRGSGEGPLFRLKDGQPLTRPRLVLLLRKALASAGLVPGNYASFRSGAATTAAVCGVPVDIIKTLGRWRSEAYQLYIRLPKNQLAEISVR